MAECKRNGREKELLPFQSAVLVKTPSLTATPSNGNIAQHPCAVEWKALSSNTPSVRWVKE
ncbi:unnamed protein product [Sphenostylis stenocarpa]|uniref:Uncharacterized protein n=1 Tax=Sphenostylis stenocarpa TaxID=92480 RepID=A0AA86VDQ4_9FABA|nr:unnamed protein product [Sphenostylis stenocarpa]